MPGTLHKLSHLILTTLREMNYDFHLPNEKAELRVVLSEVTTGWDLNPDLTLGSEDRLGAWPASYLGHHTLASWPHRGSRCSRRP